MPFICNLLIANFLMKNYITHDSAAKSLPIRESQQDETLKWFDCLVIFLKYLYKYEYFAIDVTASICTTSIFQFVVLYLTIFFMSLERLHGIVVHSLIKAVKYRLTIFLIFILFCDSTGDSTGVCASSPIYTFIFFFKYASVHWV